MDNSSMISGFSFTADDIERRLAHVILGTMAAEAKIEEERLKLSEDNEFYPEIAFNFLKTFTERLNSVQKYSSFFDFSSPGDVMEYDQLDSYKSGFIAYAQLLHMLQYYNVKCTDKIIECLVKNIDPVSYSRGLSYEAFLKLLLPQTVPSARLKVLKRKVIYEKGGAVLDQQNVDAPGAAPTKGTIPSTSIIQSVVCIFDVEINLISYTEKAKVKLQHSLQYFSLVQLFEIIDVNKKGFIDFNAIQDFVRRVKSKMVPNQYLGLLRRLNKPDTVETISFQDFKDMLTPNLPYFSAENEYQLDQAQHYHEISKDMDLSKTLNLSFNNQNYNNSSFFHPTSNHLNQTQQSMMSQLQISQAIPIAARGQYENVQDKVFFKDRQGRIVEKNHPHEPIFLPENPQVSELLKQNINIVNNPHSDQIYTIIPEQYIEAPPFAPKKIMPALPFSMQTGAQNYQQGQARTFTVQNNYELPKVDPRDLTGVDPFWQRPPRAQRQDLFVSQNQASTAVNGLSRAPAAELPSQPAIDINSITDPNAKKYIEYQQALIKKYEQERQIPTQIPQQPLQQTNQYYSAPQYQQQQLGPTQQSHTLFPQQQQPLSFTPAAIPNAPPRPIKEQFEEMYKTSPYIQDLVQMRHANTASYEPLTQNNVPQDIMKNTNILQSQFNAKSNPYNHNQLMPNGLPISHSMVGQPHVANNAVIVESMQFPINQIQNSTVLNPMISKTKTTSFSKKKIFEEESQFPQNLNDKSYQLNSLLPSNY